MRVWVAILASAMLLFVLGFLYVGTTHRDRCLKAGNAGCTILPWSGHATSPYLLHGGWGSGWWNTP